MKKLLAIVSVAVLALSIGLFGCTKERIVFAGDIKLVSAGEQYAPFQNWIYSLKDGVAADGMRKQPKDVANELEPVSVSDDVQIVLEGRTTGLQYYTLYDEQYREVYYRQDEFVMPEETGKYILCAEVAWGTKDEYDGYQYFFAMEK